MTDMIELTDELIGKQTELIAEQTLTIQNLTELVAVLKGEVESLTVYITELETCNPEKQNQIMREALEYYATQNGWESVRIMDGGVKAREALKKVDND
jgi:predicted KAP-like P-loop ATPase